MIALTGTACRWEPERLRLRLFSAAARLVTTGRRRILRMARHWPWTDTITSAFSLYRRATISSSIRAVIEVRGEPPSTWAVTVTTASLSGEIMQSWP